MRLFPALIAGSFILLCNHAFAQDSTLLSATEIKNLSVEELMNLEVTSVSKVPERLNDVASAIQVITRQDIIRSAATNIPEALRLASNLQVTQINSRHWAISARGFNSQFANKLLVMINGRSVYSPLYAGVFWDVQNVMLEDVERIEVISGPGAAMWGANSVNGVINIITRSPKETQGLYASLGSGNQLERLAELQYGGKVHNKLHYRVFLSHMQLDNTMQRNGTPYTDNWRTTRAGFNINWDQSEKDQLVFKGNFYEGKEFKDPGEPVVDGQSFMARWSHAFSDRSAFVVQAYTDRTWRTSVPLNDELFTHDLDIQHKFRLLNRQEVIWGIGYRFMDNRVQNNTARLGLLPENREMHLFSGFLQDEIALIPEKLKTTLGIKLQHNVFSGLEWMPSARVSYIPHQHHMVWAAVSRAVRAPSRIDVDYFRPVPRPASSSVPQVAGGPGFDSEKLLAYELGYRLQPMSSLSLSLAAFYNEYDDLFSMQQVPGTKINLNTNGAKGTSHGLEFSANYVVSADWRLRGGYTWFDKKLENKPGNTSNPQLLGLLGTDANHYAVLQSVFNLPRNFQFDLAGRYMDDIPAGPISVRVPEYLALDARLGWRHKGIELSLNGQNLLDKRHLELGSGEQIIRSVYGKVVFRY